MNRSSDSERPDQDPRASQNTLYRAYDSEQEIQNLQEEIDQWKTAYYNAKGDSDHFRKMVLERKDEIDSLQREILRYKKVISISTRLDDQLSDSSIQSKMDGLYYAVRDWAICAVREGNLGKSNKIL